MWREESPLLGWRPSRRRRRRCELSLVSQLVLGCVALVCTAGVVSVLITLRSARLGGAAPTGDLYMSASGRTTADVVPLVLYHLDTKQLLFSGRAVVSLNGLPVLIDVNGTLTRRHQHDAAAAGRSGTTSSSESTASSSSGSSSASAEKASTAAASKADAPFTTSVTNFSVSVLTTADGPSAEPPALRATLSCSAETGDVLVTITKESQQQRQPRDRATDHPYSGYGRGAAYDYYRAEKQRRRQEEEASTVKALLPSLHVIKPKNGTVNAAASARPSSSSTSSKPLSGLSSAIAASRTGRAAAATAEGGQPIITGGAVDVEASTAVVSAAPSSSSPAAGQVFEVTLAPVDRSGRRFPCVYPISTPSKSAAGSSSAAGAPGAFPPLTATTATAGEGAPVPDADDASQASAPSLASSASQQRQQQQQWTKAAEQATPSQLAAPGVKKAVQSLLTSNIVISNVPPAGEPVDGKCQNSQDLSVLRDTHWAHRQLANCMSSTVVTAGEAQHCLQARMGLSEGCAQCFSGAIRCAFSYCASVCILDPDAACTACTVSHCERDLVFCSGLPSRNLPFPFQ